MSSKKFSKKKKDESKLIKEEKINIANFYANIYLYTSYIVLLDEFKNFDLKHLKRYRARMDRYLNGIISGDFDLNDIIATISKEHNISIEEILEYSSDEQINRKLMKLNLKERFKR